jgi:hypothetical protein
MNCILIEFSRIVRLLEMKPGFSPPGSHEGFKSGGVVFG